jgi:hypothetical protein
MINSGDIVASNGRIRTIQGDRTRWISFERATVLAIQGANITINPAGMRATMVALEEDLVTEITADQQLQREAPAVSGTSTRPPIAPSARVTPSPPPEVVTRSKPRLSGLHIAGKVQESASEPPADDKPVSNRRAPGKPTAKQPPTTKPPSRRRKPR